MQQLERWEYWTCFLDADAERERQFLDETLHWQHTPRYTPESLVPQLNRYGQDGWELVEIRPVVVGSNADILLFYASQGERRWACTYLCAFKRRLP